jgi:hypothetical protein
VFCFCSLFHAAAHELSVLIVARPVLWIHLHEQLHPQISHPVSVLLKLPFSGFFPCEISFSFRSAPA